MPITKSAKKALRVSKKKRVFNLKRTDAMKSAIKELKKTSEQKKAQELLPTVYKAIDKAAKRGVIKKNTAARKKSGVARYVKGLGSK